MRGNGDDDVKLDILYFASLREHLGRARQQLDSTEVATVADVWSVANGGEPIPANVLAAVNQEYVDRDHRVEDGDEIAFFPPVTGG